MQGNPECCWQAPKMVIMVLQESFVVVSSQTNGHGRLACHWMKCWGSGNVCAAVRSQDMNLCPRTVRSKRLLAAAFLGFGLTVSCLVSCYVVVFFFCLVVRQWRQCYLFKMLHWRVKNNNNNQYINQYINIYIYINGSNFFMTMCKWKVRLVVTNPQIKYHPIVEYLSAPWRVSAHCFG